MSEETNGLIERVATNVGRVASPFGQQATTDRSSHDVQVAAAREMAEVKMHLIMARELPRDEIRAYDKIIGACQRPTLAESALYQYSRGGTEITGPSIRLAEVMAAHWGNLKYGWREVERVPASKDPVTGRMRPGRSTVSAYCIDQEANLTVERSFQIIHERSTRSGRYSLEDDRDIYEMAANQAARRVRACILAVIPPDVAEKAVEQCEATMLLKGDVSPEAVGKLVEAFGKFNVTREQIEQRIQRRIDAIHPAQVAHLRKVWKSLEDGMSVPSDWFQPTKLPEGQEAPPAPEVKGNEGLKAKLRKPVTPEAVEAGRQQWNQEHPEAPIDAPEAMELEDRPPAPAGFDPAAGRAFIGAAGPASEPGTAAGTPATGDATSDRPQADAPTAGPATPTSASATAASPPSPGRKGSGPPPPSEPPSAGELPLREPGEEG